MYVCKAWEDVGGRGVGVEDGIRVEKGLPYSFSKKTARRRRAEFLGRLLMSV